MAITTKEFVDSSPDVELLMETLSERYEEDSVLLFAVGYCLRNTSPQDFAEFVGITVDEAIHIYSNLMGTYAVILHN